MREYEFRGQDKNKKWHYGSLVLVTDTWYHPKGGGGFHKEWIAERVFSNGGFINLSVRHCVKPETVGQFTGLKDKNCKKIYDGDLLRFPAKDRYEKDNYVLYEVFWHDNDCASNHVGWQMNRLHFQGTLCGIDTGMITFLPKYVNKMEVVGNVFDNPELLKNK